MQIALRRNWPRQIRSCLRFRSEPYAQRRVSQAMPLHAEALWRAAQATIVLAPHSSRFARVMAAVAHRVGEPSTHVTAIGGKENVEASRWYYRQRIEAALSRSARPWFLLLDAGTHAPFAGERSDANVEEIAIAVELPTMRTEVTGLRAPQQNQQTIRPDAKLLFVAGAGWTKKQPDGQTHVEDAGTVILNFSCGIRRVAGQLEVAGGPGRRRELRSSILDASESSWTNRLNAATPEGPCYMLPWRGTTRGGLAIHRRAARRFSRS